MNGYSKELRLRVLLRDRKVAPYEQFTLPVELR